MTNPYRQCDGDVNPATYGGTFYRTSTVPDEVELLRLSPVAEYVGDREAAELDGAYWVKTTIVDRTDLARLFADEGWRSFLGMTPDDLPDPTTVDLLTLARWAASDEGYGLLDWDDEGNPTGKQVDTRYSLTDFTGNSLTDDLLDEDAQHAQHKTDA